MKKPGIAWRKYLVVLVMMAAAVFSVRTDVQAATANEKTAFEFFTDAMGLTPAAACGIMSNISAESRFQSNINGMGGAYGLCQWSGARLSRLKSWCNTKGYNYTTMKGQLNFLQYEVKTYYPKVNNYIKSVANTSKGAYNAAFYWCYYYEAPANTYSTACYRGNLAQNVYWKSMGAASLYLNASAVSKGIKLTWNKTGQYSYQVKRAAKFGGSYETIATLGSGEKSYTDSSVNVGKQYYYYVERVNSKGKSAGRSNKVSGNTRRSVKDEECSILLSQDSFVYNGKAKKPKVTVYYDGTKLRANKDYRVSYSSNKKAGTAYVKVSGKGTYIGSQKVSFRIEKAEQKVKVSDIRTVMKSKSVPIKASASGKGKLTYIVADQSIAAVKKKALALKGVGVTTITVRAAATANYQAAEKTVTLTVLPAKPVISKVSRQKDGSVLVKWNQAGGLEGFELQYVAGTAFKQGVQTIAVPKEEAGSAVVSSLQKGKTYSFRVRSYAVINEKRVYSDWSKAKKLKILL